MLEHEVSHSDLVDMGNPRMAKWIIRVRLRVAGFDFDEPITQEQMPETNVLRFKQKPKAA